MLWRVSSVYLRLFLCLISVVLKSNRWNVDLSCHWCWCGVIVCFVWFLRLCLFDCGCEDVIYKENKSWYLCALMSVTSDVSLLFNPSCLDKKGSDVISWCLHMVKVCSASSREVQRTCWDLCRCMSLPVGNRKCVIVFCTCCDVMCMRACVS